MKDKKDCKFKTGDIVKLKKGSFNKMRVEGYISVFSSDFKIYHESDMRVDCSWFEENEKKFRSFQEDELDLVQ